MPEPNELLRTARERMPSRRAPGEHMSRAELAETVCAWLWDTTDVKYELDGHYIAKLERGAVRWPGAAYRSGLRSVLNVATDNELGFTPPPGVITTEPDPTLPSTIGIDDDLLEAGDESISLLTFAEQSNVGELTVEQLHADIIRIAQSYLRTPTRPLFIRCRTIRDRAFRLLAGRQPPTQARDLYAAAGWAITLLAWMSVDLGRPDVAERHTRTAWACAEAADHDVLRAWIRATQHTAAFWQDDFIRATEFAQDGLRYAAGTSALFLASAAAVDLARSGRSADAREALANARRLVVNSEDSEPGGPFLCTPERAEGIWSDAHLALGEAGHTLEHADHSVALFEAAPYQLRNFGSERMARLQQAKAHLALGELDGATEALDPVLNTPLEYRVRPLVHRISEVAILTTRYARTPEARHLRDRIREFTQHPDLPARRAPKKHRDAKNPNTNKPTTEAPSTRQLTPGPDQPDAGTPGAPAAGTRELTHGTASTHQPDPATPSAHEPTPVSRNQQPPDGTSPHSHQSNCATPDTHQPRPETPQTREPTHEPVSARQPGVATPGIHKLTRGTGGTRRTDAATPRAHELTPGTASNDPPDDAAPGTGQSDTRTPTAAQRDAVMPGARGPTPRTSTEDRRRGRPDEASGADGVRTEAVLEQ